MLELYEYDAARKIKNGAGGMIAMLNEAFGVRIRREINSSDELAFSFPRMSPKAELITVNRLVRCEGQLYRIMRISRSETELNAECMHIWYADAAAAHIPTVPDSMGVSPYSLVRSAAQNAAGINALSDEEVKARGMSWIGMGDLMRDFAGADGEFAIDFFAADKLNLFDFVKAVTDNAGFGEIYYDNTDFAIVERIGRDTPIRLELDANMEGISSETDISQMITRLYPYGRDDMTIGSVAGKNYVDSPNAAVYGLKEGYRDYSDYSDPNDLYRNALWEFDPLNPDRKDVPSVSVTASAAELKRLAADGDPNRARLGDTVTVVDEKGTEIRERVIAMSCYPYEDTPTELTIGRVKRDLYFYLSQISCLAKRYSKCSTNSGKIMSKAISGKVVSSSVEIAPDTSVIKDDNLITVICENGARVRIGILNGEYIFNVCDNAGNEAISTDGAHKEMIFRGASMEAPVLVLPYGGGSRVITADENGAYIDGRKIVTEGESEAT